LAGSCQANERSQRYAKEISGVVHNWLPQEWLPNEGARQLT
jgi:hypothetical protein